MTNIYINKNPFGILFYLYIISIISLCFGQEKENNSTLKVNSIPDSAVVIIDHDSSGITPLTIGNLSARNYKLKIMKSGYFTKKIETDITPNTTHHLNIKLLSKKRIQNLRRVSLGALGLVFSGVSALVISRVNEAEKEKETARDGYMQLNLTESEYEQLYNTYTGKVNKTNNLINRRNTFIALAGASFIGFGISVPF